jgi:rhodanese-related sulfurtransferase
MNKQIEYYQNKLDYEMDPWDLFTALEKGEAIIPLDARKESSYLKEHIPGAICLPHGEMDEKSTKKLDKSKLYVSYCTGNGCNASTWGALKMAKLGFRVKELFGGIEIWKKEGFATEGTHATKGTEAVASHQHLRKQAESQVRLHNRASA